MIAAEVKRQLAQLEAPQAMPQEKFDRLVKYYAEDPYFDRFNSLEKNLELILGFDPRLLDHESRITGIETWRPIIEDILTSHETRITNLEAISPIELEKRISNLEGTQKVWSRRFALEGYIAFGVQLPTNFGQYWGAARFMVSTYPVTPGTITAVVGLYTTWTTPPRPPAIVEWPISLGSWETFGPVDITRQLAPYAGQKIYIGFDPSSYTGNVVPVGHLDIMTTDIISPYVQ